VQLLLFFIVTNKCTINITKVYITTVSELTGVENVYVYQANSDYRLRRT